MLGFVNNNGNYKKAPSVLEQLKPSQSVKGVSSLQDTDCHEPLLLLGLLSICVLQMQVPRLHISHVTFVWWEVWDLWGVHRLNRPVVPRSVWVVFARCSVVLGLTAFHTKYLFEVQSHNPTHLYQNLFRATTLVRERQPVIIDQHLGGCRHVNDGL